MAMLLPRSSWGMEPSLSCMGREGEGGRGKEGGRGRREESRERREIHIETSIAWGEGGEQQKSLPSVS